MSSRPETEAGRIAQVVAAARRCAVAEAVARARASCYTPTARGGTNQTEGMLLEARMAACTPFVREQPVPESTRIARVIASIENCTAKMLDPATRFVDYQGPVIPPVCPPIDTIYTNANVPKQSMTSCPLPNKFYNPVL